MIGQPCIDELSICLHGVGGQPLWPVPDRAIKAAHELRRRRVERRKLIEAALVLAGYGTLSKLPLVLLALVKGQSHLKSSAHTRCLVDGTNPRAIIVAPIVQIESRDDFLVLPDLLRSDTGRTRARRLNLLHPSLFSIRH